MASVAFLTGEAALWLAVWLLMVLGAMHLAIIASILLVAAFYLDCRHWEARAHMPVDQQHNG